jgi:simple sugar transport system substrate-binding protein
MSRLAVAALAAALAAAGCGERTTVREPDLAVAGSEPTPAAASEPQARRDLRIAFVTHGQASSRFWAVVRNGAEAAARQVGVRVAYSSPDTYSVTRLRRLVDDAVAGRPDALVVSLPSWRVVASVRRAARAGIPVLSINSGADLSRAAGALAHVGQLEAAAGAAAGQRLGADGVRRALCINQEVGNEALDRRCRAFARALARRGGRSSVLPVDTDDPNAARRIGAAFRATDADGALTLGSSAAVAALEGARIARRAGRIRIGTFDLSPEVLEAVRTRRLAFAIDQQAYLQGYLPIVLLTQKLRYGLFPAGVRVVPTGPQFVTAETAEQSVALSRQAIR